MLKNLLTLHEAITVILINCNNKLASFQQLAANIIERNLYPAATSVENLEKDVRKIASDRNDLFTLLGSEHIMIRDSEMMKGIELSNALEAIINHDYYFYHPLSVQWRVFDIALGSYVKKEINPEHFVCVKTKKIPDPKGGLRSSGRKKYLFLREYDFKGNETIGEYELNEELRDIKKKLDPFQDYLAFVSDSVLVNASFFILGKGRQVTCIADSHTFPILDSIKFSAGTKGKENIEMFEAIQKRYKSRRLLQKRILDYISANDLDKLQKFSS